MHSLSEMQRPKIWKAAGVEKKWKRNGILIAFWWSSLFISIRAINRLCIGLFAAFTRQERPREWIELQRSELYRDWINILHKAPAPRHGKKKEKSESIRGLLLRRRPHHHLHQQQQQPEIWVIFYSTAEMLSHPLLLAALYKLTGSGWLTEEIVNILLEVFLHLNM